ncbi:MAG: hypothetical protein JWP97_6794 [Labilithrix sp.]|nr:hypothetical protein [Labilithrix sp.]
MTVRRLLPLLAVVCALPPLLAACPSDPDDGPAGGDTLVVGLQSEDFGSVLESVHLRATVGGKLASDQTFPAGTSAPTALPKELVLTGHAGDRIEVLVEGLTSQLGSRNGGPNVVVTRRAATTFVTGKKKLLRLGLELRCKTLALLGETITAPVCDAPQTCASGRCTTEDVNVDQLEDYDASWPSTPPDICRPATHGPPELALGSGQTDYTPLTDGQTLQLERGPQGGHHIWIAARMKNLRQSGSRTAITARMPAHPDVVIEPAAYVFTYDRDEGNYCKLWGLRFQLDTNAADLANAYRQYLGQDLEVTVEVVDSTNASAKATRTIHIADKLLCPDGTSSCND